MFSSKRHDPVINIAATQSLTLQFVFLCVLSRCSGWGVLRAVSQVLEQISFIFCQEEASAGCWVTPGPLLGYHKSPHQQTVKVFSLSLGLFNLLQWKVIVFSWLCWTSQHDSHVASHTFPEPYLEQEIGKLTEKDDSQGIRRNGLSSIHQWESDYTQWTHYQSRGLGDCRVTCHEWPVTVSWLMTGHPTVISMSLTAQHPPLSGVSGPGCWHLREAAKQPSTVSWGSLEWLR